MKAGVDLGGTKIQAVVTDGGDRVVGRARRETPAEGGAQTVVLELGEAVRDALEDAGVEAMALSGVGVGAPGKVFPETGVVAQVSNIPGWHAPFPLAEALADDIGRPVSVGNDVNVATEAEWRHGAGRGLDSFLAVFWGTGIGAGIVLDGEVRHGRGSAGEIGHVCVRPGGRKCACGLRGCVEAYAGRGALEARARIEARKRKTALFDIARKRGRDRLTSGVWLRALQQRDAVASDLVDEAIGALGVAIGSAVNLLDVEAVVIGGGLGERLGPAWLGQIRDAALVHVFFADPPEFRLAELGDLAGAIGASLIAR